LNIIEYLFCERLFGQVLLIEKSAGKVQEKCGRKSAAEKVRQKKCGRKSVAEKVRQKKCDRKMRQKKCGRKKCAEKCSRKMRQKNAAETWLGSIYEQQHGWGLFMRDMAHLV
jgi:hypothetical protein